MRMSEQKGFEGWYFKHQKADDMVAFIPGRAESGAFIQLISQEGARQFQVSNLTVRDGIIYADRCWFSRQGCHIELPASAAKLPMAHLRLFVPISWGHSVFSLWNAGTAFSAWRIPSRAVSQWMDICTVSTVVWAMQKKTAEPPFRAPTCGCSAAIFRNHVL